MWRLGWPSGVQLLRCLRAGASSASVKWGLEQGASILARGARIDGERVDAGLHLLPQGIINEAMSRESLQPSKALADQTHGVMAALACARMPGVQMTVILQHELGGLQCLTQGRFDALGQLAHE